MAKAFGQTINCKCFLILINQVLLFIRGSFELNEELADDDSISRWRFANEQAQENNIVTISEYVQASSSSTSEPVLTPSESQTDGTSEVVADTVPSQRMITIEKKASAPFDFDDGIKLEFKDSKPKHLQFYCKTDRITSESCDVRLFKANETEIEKWRSPDVEEPISDTVDLPIQISEQPGYKCAGQVVFKESERANS